MTLRISQFAVACGLGVLTLSGVVQAQAPRYQSPLSVPATPQPQYTLPVTPAITPNATVVEDVVVHVNDQIISRSDVERGEQQLTIENQQTGASAADIADRQKNLLRDMIDKQLLLSRGKELGINADAEVIRRLDEIRKQNHLDTMEDLEKAARQQGVSFEDFKAGIRDNVITQQVVRDEVGRKLQMTQGQEQAYYDAHKQELAQPEQIRLSEILVPVPADASDATVAQAKAKADDIDAQIKAGGKFDDLAKKYSGGPTADKGGDLGQYKKGGGTLAKVLEDQTFVLKAGESTAPIRTRQGFVILKVTEHTPAGVPALKDVEPQIQEAMYSEQMQPALREYLTKLREQAYIDIRAGYVDSGASPRETKAVYTAYAPPVVKKKVAREKKRFDRGTKFSTATKAAPVVATPVAAVTAPAVTKNGKPAKPQKIKREKVRFGQAPRNSLPAGPQETASGADVGVGAASATSAENASAAAPGTAIAPLDAAQTASNSANTAENPLDQRQEITGKTRFANRAQEVKERKQTAKVKKVKEKSAATPAPESADETASRQLQSSPLGLNGDTAKKKKKKKVKGAPKERLQNKPPAPAGPAPVETPSKAPDRGTAQEGVFGSGAAQKPADQTTTPPASTPPQTPSTPPPPASPNPTTPPQ